MLLSLQGSREKSPHAILALADGTVFIGNSIGAAGSTVGEVVFNTAMTGYQEILTDPSYCQQIVTLTYPHIGNYGVNAEDVEAEKVHAAGLIIKDLPLVASNFRSRQTLSEYLRQQGTVAIANVDTRKLTRMVGQSLASQGVVREVTPPYFSVKEAVFPFVKFPGVDTILGPEMKSTGEVMGVGKTFGEAFVKSQLGAGTHLPKSGKVFISVKNNDKARAVEVARGLAKLGFELIATKGTAAAIGAAGIECATVNKVTEGRPHIVDMGLKAQETL